MNTEPGLRPRHQSTSSTLSLTTCDLMSQPQFVLLSRRQRTTVLVRTNGIRIRATRQAERQFLYRSRRSAAVARCAAMPSDVAMTSTACASSGVAARVTR